MDIDPNEIGKLHMDFAKEVLCDTAVFVPSLCRRARGMGPLDTGEWLRFCRAAKAAYPACRETQPKPQVQTNMYLLGVNSPGAPVWRTLIVGSSSGRASVIPAMSYEFKRGTDGGVPLRAWQHGPCHTIRHWRVYRKG